MRQPSADGFHRSAKLLVDTGKAKTLQEAEERLKGWILQIDVGPGLANDSAATHALLTAINAGRRAFLGA